MKPKEAIHKHTKQFLEICLGHQVSRLYAFGSALTEKFNEQSSDVDLLVEVEEEDPVRRGEILMSLWDELEIFFGRKVDLLTHTTVKNPVLKKNIEASKILIYDGSGQKVLV